MRRPFLIIAVGIAMALASGREGLIGGGFGGGTGGFQSGGGGAGAQSVGAGSFSRPSGGGGSQFQHGGGETGGWTPPKGTFSQPNPSTPSVVYPKTSVPTFVTPARPVQTFKPAPTGTTTGGGFIRLPGANGVGTTSNVPHNFPDHRAIGVVPGSTTSSHQTRSFGTAAVTGLGTMPAIQQHLQRRGQNLQAWSASRDQAFNQFHQQYTPRLQEFESNRTAQWSQLRGHGGDLVRMARERGADWQTYRRDLWNYRYNRAGEVRDRIRDGYDDLFTYDWWRQHHGRNFVLGNYSPWWWWNPCPWNTAVAFGGYGWGAPIYYDYGANVLVGDGSDVYFDGQDWGPSDAYAQQAIDLANPQAGGEEPVPPQAGDQQAEWQPFGVFALTQQENGDAIVFFQLAMNKEGLISGAMTNSLTDDSETVTGSIDRTTQKAAWHVGDKTDTVYETGVANLTLDVAPVLIHFGTKTTQTWLLVRLPSPDLSTAPPANTVPRPP